MVNRPPPRKPAPHGIESGPVPWSHPTTTSTIVIVKSAGASTRCQPRRSRESPDRER